VIDIATDTAADAKQIGADADAEQIIADQSRSISRQEQVHARMLPRPAFLSIKYKYAVNNSFFSLRKLHAQAIQTALQIEVYKATFRTRETDRYPLPPSVHTHARGHGRARIQVRHSRPQRPKTPDPSSCPAASENSSSSAASPAPAPVPVPPAAAPHTSEPVQQKPPSARCRRRRRSYSPRPPVARR